METEPDLCLQEPLQSKIKIEEIPLEYDTKPAEDAQWYECDSQNPENTTYCCASTVETHKCKTCDFETNLKIELLEHSSVTHEKLDFPYNFRCYRCVECSFESFSKFILQSHYCRPKSSKFEFSEFEMKFETPPAPAAKEFTKKGEWYECDECPYRTTVNNRMHQHNRMKHMKPEEGQWFECANCDYKNRHKSNLKKHITRRHTNPEAVKWLECAHCPYRTRIGGSMDRHQRAKHAKPEEGHWFKCAHCHYKTRQKYNLKLHMLRKHTDPEGLDCEYYTDGTEVRKCNENEWFECVHCRHKTRRKDNLKMHILSLHTNPDTADWLECDRCLYRTLNGGNLRKHIEKHLKLERASGSNVVTNSIKNK